ncbi:hypothetical protein AMATHDRAFT_72570 [Amanita thiersii Skay4041]|uniref:RAVE complex protein Rav1 C-terminal domain-containing protein n=1 Tax=Amanita thiersii Skay4041 TaxID=703135 RepID=A0A2A9P1U3_9AGAR|nr:hypothetical protein AMATHDRAFT_72570 [Amanita thiersii Skay4041]
MLQPQHSYAAFPPAALYHLLLPDAVLLLYPSVDGIVILDAQSLVLRHVLAFWEAFPGTRHSKDTITCMTIDAGMKLVVAAMKSRVAAWSPSGKQNSWRVHSTLVLPSTSVVTTLDSKSGLLAVGCLSGLSVYTLILDNDLPTWSPKWMVPTPIPALIRFCPSLQFIAVTTQTDNEVRIYATTSGRQTQGICHPRPVINLSWRHSQASNRDDLTLYTITSDSTLRIFMPVLDLPRRLQLHASLDPFSCLPFSITSKYTNPSDSTVFWLDRGTVTQALESALAGSPPEDDVRSRRIKDIINEGWDLFFRIFSDGSIVVTAVANIDRRPPTLLKQFTLQHLFPPSLHPPLHLFVLPSGTPSCLTLITSPPLASHIILPLSFFDAQVDGFQLKAELLTRVSEEEAEVVRFMRTPEGRGVAAVRGNGGGDVWRVGEKGTKLQRSGCWVAAEFVVVLNEGRNFAAYSFQTGILTLYGSKIHSIPLPRIISLFSLPSQEEQENIFAITTSFIIIQIRVIGEHELFIHSESRLPLSTPPQKILPVDPMSWSTNRTANSEHDVLLSLSGTGELQFWLPEGDTSPEWRCTGKVRTGRLGMRKARCSSAKKTALIVPTPDGEELTIWDSKESEFAAGLEYRYIYNEKVNDLDWTSTPDQQSILAVGFTYHVELLCQQRMTYFEHVLGWTLCHRIEIGSSIPYPISDSIWLANGSFLIGAGHHLCLYGESKSTEIHESLFEYVARLNGPLPDYHPQMLLQCLLWGKVELVKNIIINLVHDLKAYDADPRIWHWTSLPVSQFYETDASSMEENDAIFSRRLVTSLIDALENQPIPHLTPNEQAHLIVLIQTTLEIDEQRRALDSNGLRYLISMRSFYILNRRASAPVSPESYCAQHRRTGTGRRERLRYRDMVWAFHSECQGLLLNASIAACNGKMVWSGARALGLPLWLNSTEELKSQLEMIARNEYLAGDNRDPTACSLFYFALGKIKLVYGLWRQAAWHKEQTVMLKFLSNDFSEPRWRTAALKNAYALMSKQRFEYAAAFFLLGNSLKDAVNVCIKQLGDFQLAVALARVVEPGNEGPVLLEILNNHVLPIAFTNGNRWLASWAFWLLHRRDLAVRVLLTPLQDITAAYGIVVEEIGEPHYDDPSLALLFRQLRAKTLQAVKGTSEISGRSEFNFVLQMARVFCRMGCHPLALDLVRSWSFEHPSSYAGAPQPITPSSPTVSRNIFAIESNLRHRSSILIDMDIPSLPPTRAVSPQPGQKSSAHDQGDLASRKTRIGNLMKFAKKDVQVPEFDMNAFI